VGDAAEALSEERRRLQDTMGEHGPEAAVDEWRAAHGVHARGGGARAFFADYAGLATWPVSRRELRALAAPVAVLTSPAAAPHTLAAAEALAGLLPAATRGADDDVAAAVTALLAA
jgi:hypothetical protein